MKTDCIKLALALSYSIDLFLVCIQSQITYFGAKNFLYSTKQLTENEVDRASSKERLPSSNELHWAKSTEDNRVAQVSLRAQFKDNGFAKVQLLSE